ncbi:MAG TPA: histidine--tRNA ligase [Bacillota bacterium]|nr:histidine--tRNA ligase [Bacillota bacterium]HPE38849.1 histidine--tRNA ligase [Bacillota bacterium]
MKYSCQKGTKDILPEEVYRWQIAERTFAEICGQFGYREIRIPTFEQTDLFLRSVGDTTDVVQKEMYTFEDKGGRSITLRPEGTAGVVRSYIEHGMSSLPSPVRMFYNITAFRYEKMQKGRYREFHQFGLEAFGAKGPSIDAEIISVLVTFFERMGLQHVKLCINSIGCPTCREAYHKLLREYFAPHLESMCEDCRSRYGKNPLRMLDCKEEHCHALAAGAPHLIDHLCDECKEHFNGLTAQLDALGIRYEIDPGIVRGLDYYTKTVFEFVSENVGTQGTICGGGRYDGLVESMGGQSVPGIGFAMGAERFLLEAEAQNIPMENPQNVRVYIANMSEDTIIPVQKLAFALRRKGIGCETDLMNRSFRAQLKYAGKSSIPYLLVIGDEEVTNGVAKLKRMSDGEEIEVKLQELDQTLSEIVKS